MIGSLIYVFNPFSIIMSSVYSVLYHPLSSFVIHSICVLVFEVLAGIRRSAGAVSIPSIPFFDPSSPTPTFVRLKLPCTQVTFMEESYIGGANPNSKQV